MDILEKGASIFCAKPLVFPPGVAWSQDTRPASRGIRLSLCAFLSCMRVGLNARRLLETGAARSASKSFDLRSIVAHVCGDPLSRYTCRATRVAADFLRILGLFRCSSSIALHPLLEGPVAPVALELPGVSLVKLPLRRCRTTWGCSNYTCGCRATLCN